MIRVMTSFDFLSRARGFMGLIAASSSSSSRTYRRSQRVSTLAEGAPDLSVSVSSMSRQNQSLSRPTDEAARTCLCYGLPQLLLLLLRLALPPGTQLQPITRDLRKDKGNRGSCE